MNEGGDDRGDDHRERLGVNHFSILETTVITGLEKKEKTYIYSYIYILYHLR